MDRLRAFTVLTQRIRELNDDEMLQALDVILQPPTSSPPTVMGRATHEASQLAEQFTKTGFLMEWETPPLNSKAMERLIHRLTNVLEALLAMYGVMSIGNAPSGYCPKCGHVLDFDGDCLRCLAAQVLNDSERSND